MEPEEASLFEDAVESVVDEVDQEREAKRARHCSSSGDMMVAGEVAGSTLLPSTKKEEAGDEYSKERGAPPPSSSSAAMPPPLPPSHGTPSGVRVKPEAGAGAPPLPLGAGGLPSLAPDDTLKPGSYTLREHHLMKQEAEKEIAFVYVENDGTAQNIIYLTGLKNIYVRRRKGGPEQGEGVCC